ncbi:NAD-dependent epimerase/dehydratase family protein [Microbulbifer epialgicus]|uniref:NAD-dependent epimerase/dehydratase family protein n=1 Tax=Microbulbifer epialgicus TaxID=393907 RepID=A0ABV4P0B3_9GAMM
MHQVLITGATGFVGSALAANFLARGVKVIALSRNDPDSMRTINAVLTAAHGCQLDVSGAVESHLQIINTDFSKLETTLATTDLLGVTEVWHVAAEMSYSPHKLETAINTNVGNSARLYETVQQLAPNCRRFYYVSTAYVAGMAGGRVKEELHPFSQMVNTYQTTKWCAEQSLHLLALRNRLPVTIFRPSVVVGHRHTHWVHRNGFGFYMFQDAMLAVANAGKCDLAVDLLPEPRLDLVSVDQLCADACSLTLRNEDAGEFEVFHCAGGVEVPAEKLVEIWASVAGIRAHLGSPTTSIEQKFDRAVRLNQRFVRIEWRFDRSRLDAATGRKDPVKPLREEEVRALCSWYADKPSTTEVSKVPETAVAQVG